jgi:hypothetical protein
MIGLEHQDLRAGILVDDQQINSFHLPDKPPGAAINIRP